jgi:hypothetical protein
MASVVITKFILDFGTAAVHVYFDETMQGVGGPVVVPDRYVKLVDGEGELASPGWTTADLRAGVAAALGAPPGRIEARPPDKKLKQ